MKKCSNCKQWKDEKDFYIRKTKNGFSSQCKQCLRKKANDYTHTDKFIKKRNILKENNKQVISYGATYSGITKIYYGVNFRNQIVFNSLKEFKWHLSMMENDKKYKIAIMEVLNNGE